MKDFNQKADFYPQCHTMEHEAEHTEFRAETLGSVSIFIDPSFVICSSQMILWDNSGNISV